MHFEQIYLGNPVDSVPAFDALKHYVKITNGVANNKVMRQVAGQFNTTIAEMNRYWKHLPKTAHEKTREARWQ